MKSSVRKVCRGCLRSVEVWVDDKEGVVNHCPYCSGAIDSHLSRADDSGAERDDDDAARARTETGEMIDWAKTWDRGSLGSLGRFQLRERLGEGGFGEVYLAYDPRLDRDVAVKVLKQANPSERMMGRFFREARAVARLDHPNIVMVHDAGFDNGRCWVAYQHVVGKPLWLYRDQNAMDAITAARIIRALADAVDHAHRMGVVHRDLKPANVIIDDLGRPRLIDFGLARRSDLDSDLTRDGAVVGTPAYMSPEQAMGRSRDADERTDVYSLGVIFFELLGGRRPEDSSTLSTPVRSGGRVPPPAIFLKRSIPAPLYRICKKAMAEDPVGRYSRARALVDEIDEWLRWRHAPGGRLWRRVVSLCSGLATVGLIAVGARQAVFPGPIRTDVSSALGQLPGISALLSARLAERSPRAEPRAIRPAAPEPKVPASDGLIGNRETRLYHRVHCPSVHAMADRNRYTLESAIEARALGFRACDKCRPSILRVPGPDRAIRADNSPGDRP